MDTNNKCMHSQTDGDFFEMLLAARDTSEPVVAIPAKHPSEWTDHSEEGQLAVDIVDAGENILVIAPIAGCDVESLAIYIQDDLLTIRGERHAPLGAAQNTMYHHKECFWGTFSRTIVLPVHVEGYRATSEYKKGVLSIVVPKKHQTPLVPITIIDD